MEALVYVGLGNAAAAVAVAALAVAVARLGRRPALAHRAWLLVYLKLLAPPLLAVPVPWLLAAATPVAPAPPPELPPAVWESVPTPVRDEPAARADAAPAPRPAAGVALGPPIFPDPAAPVPRSVPVPDPVPDAEPAPTPAFALPSWPVVIGGVWLAGSVVWWSVAAARVVRFSRVLREARPAPPEVDERLRRVAGRIGLRRLPRAYVADAAVPPLVWAPGPAAALLLPLALWERLGDAGRDALLAHELAHLRRRDHWVRRLEWLVQGLYWWHPLVWWVRGRVRDAEEECCDAWVGWALPDAAAAYAAALVEAVTYVSRAHAATPAGASGSGRSRGLKRRLVMILNDRPERGLTWGGVAAVVAAAVLLLPLVPCWAEPAEPPAAAEDPTTPARALPNAGGEEKPDPQPVTLPRAAYPTPAPAGGVQPPAAGTGNRLSPPPQPALDVVPVAMVQDARDAVELLEVQLGAKKAQLEAAKVAADEAAKQFARLKRLHDNGTASVEELGKAEAEAAVRMSEVRVKEAEIRESAIRLRQAQRRLAMLSGATAVDPLTRPAPAAQPPARMTPRGGADPKNADTRRTLERLERQIEELREEVKRLRQQVGPQAGGAGTGGRPVALYVRSGDFKLPFQIDPARPDVREVRLYISRDDGKTWDLEGKVSPNKGAFALSDLAEGVHLLKVATVDGEGRQDPEEVSKGPAGVRVVVDTTNPDLQLKAERGGKKVAVSWETREENPDVDSFRLSYRRADAPEEVWTPVPVESAVRGSTAFRLEEAGAIIVRAEIKDLAGNGCESQVRLPAAP